MDFNKVKRQEGDVWTDGEGQSVPRKYVSDYQKMEERKVNAIFNLLKTSWEQLKNRKKEVKRHADELIASYIKSQKGEASQQSFTFYNFNRTVLFEVENIKLNGKSRVYYRIRVRNDETKTYDLLDVNFSSLDI